ncbi:MAG TPA: aminodeoxychorismate synthase component I [Polyangiaceae bacterium]|nr:aminodeoxychorismate synthase component I [Polyangiaceae bacterium]
MPATEAPFVLLVESHRDADQERGLLFNEPQRLIQCRAPGDVLGCLRELDAAVAAGRYVAGFLSYEAGYGLMPKLGRLAVPPSLEDTLWFGVFERCRELRGRELGAWLAARSGSEPARVSELQLNRDRAQHRRDFQQIQAYLQAGDSYQVCQSLRARFRVQGSPAALFGRLRAAQRTPYSALVETGEYSLVSLSPELFFRKRGAEVELQPMKGTAASGRDAEEDARISERLRADEKTRAENVMIVDLLRNDIGRIAEPGSVRVPELFSVERFDQVLQMTSTITARVDPALGLAAMMQSLFPSGSVTGAPKLRTMQIIHELEPSARGIFCGSIGYVTPSGDACFNVAIRSLAVGRDGSGVLGIGSGVVVDSQSDAELDECLLKARFLSDAAG